MPELPASKLLVILSTALVASLLPTTSCAVSLPSAHAPSNLEPGQIGGRLETLSEWEHKSSKSGSRSLPISVEELKKEIESLRNYQGGLLKQVKKWRVRRDTKEPWWRKFLNFSNKKTTGVAADITFQPESDRRTGSRAAKLATNQGIPGTTKSQRPSIEQPPVDKISKMFGSLLPNTYFSKPRFRYPYYDRGGKGYLLYGYGEKDLYEYSVFKPLEGYY